MNRIFASFLVRNALNHYAFGHQLSPALGHQPRPSLLVEKKSPATWRIAGIRKYGSDTPDENSDGSPALKRVGNWPKKTYPKTEILHIWKIQVCQNISMFFSYFSAPLTKFLAATDGRPCLPATAAAGARWVVGDIFGKGWMWRFNIPDLYICLHDSWLVDIYYSMGFHVGKHTNCTSPMVDGSEIR